MKRDCFILMLEVVTMFLIVISQLYKRTVLECVSLALAVAVCFMEFKQPRKDKTIRYLFLGLTAALSVLLVVSILQVIYPAA